MNSGGLGGDEPGMIWLYGAMERVGYQSLSELAESCGLNKGTLSKYFRLQQNPSVRVIPHLCEALDVSPEELLRGLQVIN